MLAAVARRGRDLLPSSWIQPIFASQLSPIFTNPINLKDFSPRFTGPTTSPVAGIHVDANTPPRPSAVLLDGRAVAAAWQDELAKEVSYIRSCVGRPPGLGVILVGERPDSQLYVARKSEACERVGIYADVRHLPSSINQRDLRNAVHRMCRDPLIDGVLVQLPLPQHIDEEDIIESFDPQKDVDGFHPLNVGRTLMRGRSARFVPCTALGCVELLKRSHVPIKDQNVVIVGDSNIVGMPLAMLFRDEGAATVTVVHRSSYSGLFKDGQSQRSTQEVAEQRAIAEACLPPTPGPSPRQPYEVSYLSSHPSGGGPGKGKVEVKSHPPPPHLAELAGITRTADILVVAVGYPHLIKGDWIKSDAVVLDVGINVVDGKDVSGGNQHSGGSMVHQLLHQQSSQQHFHVVGDVDFDQVVNVASAITPVPGGVGPMTIAAVLHNTIRAARVNLKLN